MITIDSDTVRVLLNKGEVTQIQDGATNGWGRGNAMAAGGAGPVCLVAAGAVDDVDDNDEVAYLKAQILCYIFLYWTSLSARPFVPSHL